MAIAVVSNAVSNLTLKMSFKSSTLLTGTFVVPKLSFIAFNIRALRVAFDFFPVHFLTYP